MFFIKNYAENEAERLVLGTGGIATFCKNWVQVLGEYFLQFGVSG